MKTIVKIAIILLFFSSCSTQKRIDKFRDKYCNDKIEIIETLRDTVIKGDSVFIKLGCKDDTVYIKEITAGKVIRTKLLNNKMEITTPEVKLFYKDYLRNTTNRIEIYKLSKYQEIMVKIGEYGIGFLVLGCLLWFLQKRF